MNIVFLYSFFVCFSSISSESQSNICWVTLSHSSPYWTDSIFLCFGNIVSGVLLYCTGCFIAIMGHTLLQAHTLVLHYVLHGGMLQSILAFIIGGFMINGSSRGSLKQTMEVPYSTFINRPQAFYGD